MDDARIAVETGENISGARLFSPYLMIIGVDGVDVVIGTSSYLREFSHGKDMSYIIKTTIEVINFVKSKGIEVRFSTEDSFWSDLVDLLSIYQTVDKIGVNRVGIADTVGCANPRQVYGLVRTLRGVVGCDIEIHPHNDTGMGKPVVPSDVIDMVLKWWFHQRLLMHTVLWKQVQPTSIPVSGLVKCLLVMHLTDIRFSQRSLALVNVSESHPWADLLPASTLPTPSTSSPGII